MREDPNTFARGRCLARLHNAVLIHAVHLKDLLRNVQPQWLGTKADLDKLSSATITGRWNDTGSLES